MERAFHFPVAQESCGSRPESPPARGTPRPLAAIRAPDGSRPPGLSGLPLTGTGLLFSSAGNVQGEDRHVRRIHSSRPGRGSPAFTAQLRPDDGGGGEPARQRAGAIGGRGKRRRGEDGRRHLRCRAVSSRRQGKLVRGAGLARHHGPAPRLPRHGPAPRRPGPCGAGAQSLLSLGACAGDRGILRLQQSGTAHQTVRLSQRHDRCRHRP